MKQTILSAILLALAVTAVHAQDDKEKKGFQKDNLFTGGSLTASFYTSDSYTGGTILGVNPMIGYRLSNWVDAGLVFNYTYEGATDFYGTKIRQNVSGGGVFARLYPVRFLFLQGQFEHNFTNETDTYSDGLVDKFKGDANSFLVGAGIVEGRKDARVSFYLSLLFDVLKNPGSPYVQNIYENNILVATDMIPIVRAGINIRLFQGRNSGYDSNRGDGHRHPRNYM